MSVRSVRLELEESDFTCLKAAHIFAARALSAAPFLGIKCVLCFLNCPHAPVLLNPAAEKESDCADGGKRFHW